MGMVWRWEVDPKILFWYFLTLVIAVDITIFGNEKGRGEGIKGVGYFSFEIWGVLWLRKVEKQKWDQTSLIYHLKTTIILRWSPSKRNLDSNWLK